MTIKREHTQEYELGLVMCRNQNNKSYAFHSKLKEDLLQKSLDGKFVLDETFPLSIHQSTIEGINIGEKMRIMFLNYVGADTHSEGLTFQEYVELGRPKKLSIVTKKEINSL